MSTLIATVCFIGSLNPSKKYYDFLAASDQDLKPGDAVIVDTSRGLSIAEVKSLKPFEEGTKAIKWVMTKIDLDAYSRRKEKYQEEIHGKK